MGTDILEELDSSASKKPGRRTRSYYKNDSTKSDFDTNLNDSEYKRLSTRTMDLLKQFIADFVEAGFTTLISSIRRNFQVDHSLNAFMKYHFFYVISWILAFERLFRDSLKMKDGRYFQRIGYLNAALSEETIKSVVSIIGCW
ncbi:unnamed protein product [Ambrosiozyma monospora]|uniref:Unnamed protein product n=1 Tax=Ambrosiozyma monospora TaxID=43982 RepID=A0ACB5U8H0_AMBMO|nr:unnamed protein product [Ambrosiozyma monospora]